nr:putative pentatricopeptide repeat-containing protein At2g01510 [Arachis hypogaea]
MVLDDGLSMYFLPSSSPLFLLCSPSQPASLIRSPDRHSVQSVHYCAAAVLHLSSCIATPGRCHQCLCSHLRRRLSPLRPLLPRPCGIAILLQGRQVHSVVVKMGSEQNVFVVSALIDMYSKGGDIGEARAVLDQASNKNSVLWTSMIMAYAHCGRGLEALELFDHLLVEKEFIPDHVCFTAILTACNHAGFLHKGVEYFNKMSIDYQLSPDIDQYACLIDLYARNGNLRRARDLMVEMPYDPNTVIWSSFLNSCKIHGDVELGREAADQLIKMEPCNAAPYLSLAQIYAKKGLWNKVAEVRSLMQRRRIRKPAGWSWIEVDKKLHVFAVDDVTHQQSIEIYAELEKIYLGIIEVPTCIS